MAASRTTPTHAHRTTALELPADRPLRVVVVADTHSQPHPNVGSVIRGLSPDAILHGGDIGRLSVLEELATLAPLTAVRGNIDGQVASVPDSVAIQITQSERVVLTLLLMHIAVYGTKLRGDAFRLAREHKARVVVCGHSHVPFMGRDKGLVVFNPGSIGPRRGNLPITLGYLELSLKGVELKHINCETGQPWTPKGALV